MKLDITSYDAVHLDGHQADAALYYARAARENGVLTSLDGGAMRVNTEEVLNYIDVAVVAEAFCAELKLTPKEALAFFKIPRRQDRRSDPGRARHVVERRGRRYFNDAIA